ncbi:MAG: DUF4168 domain-containing protein [Elainellaceae cyanobacterium]
MLKNLLVSGSICAVLLSASLPVQAQQPNPQQSPDAQGTPQPEMVDPDSISEQELEMFVDAVQTISSIQAQSREAAVSVVESSGLGAERFSEILQAIRSQQSPETPAGEDTVPMSDISPEELATFEQTATQIAQIQQAAQQEMRQAIVAEGLEVERFQEIARAVSNDSGLQQQVQEMLENQG